MSEESNQVPKRAGDTVFREGDPADYAYIIENGCIEISVEREGTPFVLGELRAGEIVGEMAVIDEHTRTATATVVEDCSLRIVTPQQIRRRIEDADPIVRSLMKILLTRYRSGLIREQGTSAPLPPTRKSDSQGVQKIRLENELIGALDAGNIKVVYQPIRQLKEKSVDGFEALVRWDHSALGPIPSAELIRLAEETDLITSLGHYVFKTAIQDLSAFAAKAPRELFMSINASPKHASDPQFLDRIREICDTTGQKPHNVVIELTESFLVDIRQLSDWTQAAKERGFRISVDDFGIGFASLEYLTRLVPDIVKIDRTFIHPVVEDWRTVAVLRRVLQMAKDLNVQVIAEGAETLEHIQILTDLGFDMAQGFIIGRPLPSTDSIALISEQ